MSDGPACGGVAGAVDDPSACDAISGGLFTAAGGCAGGASVGFGFAFAASAAVSSAFQVWIPTMPSGVSP